MNLERHFRSTSFRLTILYIVIFQLSAVVLLGVIYLGTAGYMREQLDAEIDTDLNGLMNIYRSGGVKSLEQRVSQRTPARRDSGPFYLLQDSAGRRLAGNLPPQRIAAGWQDIADDSTEGQDRNGQDTSVRGKSVVLPEAYLLVVGRSANQVEGVLELILSAFGWASGLTLVLGALGGALLSRRYAKRVEAIETTTREIMDGDLRRRLPVTGTRDEFDRLATSINAMLDRIERLMPGLEQVSSDIAHDLRTPIARMRQRIERAMDRSTSADELRDAMGRALEDSDQVLSTFEAILRIAHIESRSQRSAFAPLDLSQLLTNLLETYAPVAEDGSRNLAGTIAPGLVVRGDRDLLVQMFANLIENALRHTPSGSKVEVSLGRVNDEIIAVVSDNGPGIPAEYRDKVFQRFYRLDASRSTPSSGLGLSFVAAVADLHDVKIELDDNSPGLRVSKRFVA
jgi:signal transduction histidine kinase